MFSLAPRPSPLAPRQLAAEAASPRDSSLRLTPLAPLFCLLLILAGCPRPESEPRSGSVRLPLEGVTLRLAVVDDPALAAAVVQARGEWNAQTGAELEVTEISEKELERAETLPADAVLCPSFAIGVLAERNLIEPVPENITRGDPWDGIFDLPKLREAAWGKQIVAVPFGSPVFCCYYRADLLKKLGRHPPRTWSEYRELAELLAKNSPLPLGEGPGVRAHWSAAIEPLAPGWAGLTLLARAAPYAKHRDNFSTLFNIETMAPLIAGPPMVHALEELAAAAKLGPDDPFQFDPAKVRAAFWRGECGMAISWPTAAEERVEGRGERGEFGGPAASESGGPAASESGGLAASAASNSARVGFAELPGSRRVFNLSENEWDKRADDDDRRVPLLAVAGRMGVVGKGSPHREAAFQLLLWLSDDRMSPQISALSPATTMFRRSNLDVSGQWVEETVLHAAAAQYGEATLAAFSHEQWLGALRIPGRAEYLAALDEAVAAAVRGEKSAQEALQQAETKWREITKRLGLDRQKAAYRHSVGLE
ncbi:MAG: extracellular solute-binding protein [Planctomycetales bacterium]|nr:extracellular solute-binding protein [Planctomycetales bacterium]